MRASFPGSPAVGEAAANLVRWDGRLDEGLQALDSARKKGDPRSPDWGAYTSSTAYATVGRYREALATHLQAAAIDSARGSPLPPWETAAWMLERKSSAGIVQEADIKALDDAVARSGIEKLPTIDRPYLYLARVYAGAGKVDKAKQLLAKYDTELGPDTAQRRGDLPTYKRSQSYVARAERRWLDAARLAREGDRAADGPVNCFQCLTRDLFQTFGTAGMADSLIAAYEAYASTDWGKRQRHGPDVDYVPPELYEALAKAYDSRGNTAKAAELYRDFVESWKKADPELQPRVAAARKRLAELTPVEGKKK
jgi:tetratricopeptide (TPR) repeat protein